jgi:tetratricopeptide (TPR) repeat protein
VAEDEKPSETPSETPSPAPAGGGGAPGDKGPPSPGDDVVPDESGSLLPLLLIGLLLAVGVTVGVYLSRGPEDDGEDASARAVALLRQGEEIAQSRDVEQALPYFKEAYQLDPENPEVNLALGRALSILGHDDLALPCLQFVAERSPEVAGVHHILGKSLFGLQRFDEAEAALLQAREQNPDDPGPLFELGLVSLQRNDATQAVERLGQFLAQTNKPHYLAQRFYADALNYLGREEEALDALSELARLAPGDVDLRRALQDRRLRRFGMAKTVEESQQRVAGEASLAVDLYLHGRLLCKDWRTRAEGKEFLARAYEADSSLTWPQIALAGEARKEGDFERARRLLTEAAQLQPGLSILYLVRGQLEREAGEFNAARENLAKVQGARGVDAAFETLGTYLDEGRGDDALGYAQSLVEGLEPVHALHRVHARALIATGRFDEARAVYDTLNEALPEEAKGTLLGDMTLLAIEVGDNPRAQRLCVAWVRFSEEVEGRPSPEALLWGGVLVGELDPGLARARWERGAAEGLPYGGETLATWACKRLIGQATPDELEAAAEWGGWADRNDALFVEGLARELEGFPEPARGSYEQAQAATRGVEFPGREIERALLRVQ